MFRPAYLDHNATTPLDPAVLAAMLPWLESQFGNASSRHEFGRAARRAVDEARQQVAAAVNAHPTEIVFTSGGSEANNLFLKGAAASLRPGLIAVGATEHPCVLKPAAQLAGQGWKVQNACGRRCWHASIFRLLARPSLAKAKRLLSIMMANNETGVDPGLLLRLASARQGFWRLVS
jgi:cysteine desulfurase